MTTRRPALGRGLSALIPTADPAPDRGGLLLLPIRQIRAASTQPRTAFDQAHIRELAESVKANGILQPLVVRQIGHERYEIIAGERRFRASQVAGLTEIPVVVREATDAEAFELALVENVQRQDLNPVEEALAYRHLADVAGMTQDQMAKRVGKDRATVANALRLLKLPPAVLELLAAARLSAGHARAVLTCPDAEAQAALAQSASEMGWSVRETERRARERKAELSDPDPAEAEPVTETRSAATAAVEAQLRAALGAPVRLQHRAGKGRIEIRFHSLDELERLIDLLADLQGR